MDVESWGASGNPNGIALTGCSELIRGAEVVSGMAI